jgi:hypothetical protein
MELATTVLGCEAGGDLLCVEASRSSASVAVGSEVCAARALPLVFCMCTRLSAVHCAAGSRAPLACVRACGCAWRRRAPWRCSTRAAGRCARGCATRAAPATPSRPSHSTQVRAHTRTHAGMDGCVCVCVVCVPALTVRARVRVCAGREHALYAAVGCAVLELDLRQARPSHAAAGAGASTLPPRAGNSRTRRRAAAAATLPRRALSCAATRTAATRR